MSCREVHTLLSPFLDGRLEPGLRAEFEAHLGQCAACAERLDELRRTVELLNDAFSGQAVDSERFAARAAENASRAAATERSETMSRRLRLTLGTVAKVAAALVLGIGLVLVLGRPRPQESRDSAAKSPAAPAEATLTSASVERAIEPTGLGRVELARGVLGLRAPHQARWSLARAGRAIEAGDTLRTGAEPTSCARLVLRDGDRVSLNNATAVRVSEGPSVGLLGGDAHFRVAPVAEDTLKQELERGTPANKGESRVPRPSSYLGVRRDNSRNASQLPGAQSASRAGRQPFTVVTPLCTLRVTGTDFGVSVTADRTAVAVTEGAVVLTVRGQEHEVAAGRSCVVTGGGISWGAAAPPDWLARLDRAPEPETLGRLLARIDGKDVPLAIRSHKVTVTIRDQIAYTLVDEEYENNTDRRLEGTFYYPLPADASISRFAMYIDGNLMEGEVVERQRAREVYESIVRRKRDPALLEWMAGNEFKARVFPIEAHSAKRVLLGYTQVLPVERGQVRYTYPLKSEKLTANPLRYLRIELDAWTTPPMADFGCPTHNVTLQTDERHGRAVFEARDYVPTRDFLASYSLLGSKAELYGSAHWREDEGGYIMAFLSPSTVVAEVPESGGESAPADVLLMIDTSASMAGDDFAVARQLAATTLNFLGEKDRFNLLLYDLTPRLVFPSFVENSPENRQLAIQALGQVEPLGASDLAAAIAAAGRACKLARETGDAVGPASGGAEKGVPRAGLHALRIVYLGDGVATFGATEPAQLLDAAKKAFASQAVRVSTLAIGTHYDQTFIEGLARQFGGVSNVVSSSRPIGEVVSELINDSFRPTLTDLKLTFEGVEVRDVYPRELPNLLVGGQAIVTGRYAKPGAGKMILTATCGGAKYRKEVDLVLSGEKGPSTYLPRLWARRAMDDLLYRIGRGEKKLEPQVIDLSLRYSLMSPYTSFLVLETEQDYKQFGIDRRFTMEQWTGAPAEGVATPGPAQPKSEPAPSFHAYYSIEDESTLTDAHTDELFSAKLQLGEGRRGSSAGEKLRPFDELDAYEVDARTTEDLVMPAEAGKAREAHEELALDLPAEGPGDDWSAGSLSDLGPLASRLKRLDSSYTIAYRNGPIALTHRAGEPSSTEWSGPGRRASRVTLYDSVRREPRRSLGYVYPRLEIPQPRPEPKPAELTPEVRKAVEAFAQGPLDFVLHSKMSVFDAKEKLTRTDEGWRAVVGKKRMEDLRRDGRRTTCQLSDGELFYVVHDRLGYAAARKATSQDLTLVQRALPGLVDCSPDGFLLPGGTAKIESQDANTVVLITETTKDVRQRYFVDTAGRMVTKIETYIRRGAGEPFRLNATTVYDQVKPIGGRSVPTHWRQFDAEGKLISETVHDKLLIGAIEETPTFKPPDAYMVATYPLPSVAEARKAAENAARPDEANLVLALALEQDGRFADAAKAMEKVIAARPRDPYPLLFQGWLLAASGDADGLLKAIGKAQKLPAPAPFDAEQIAERRHEILHAAQQLLNAASLYPEGQKLTPALFETSPRGSQERINYADSLARSYANQDDPQKGKEIWVAVLKEAPSNASAWLRFGGFLQGRPEFADEAERAFLKAEELGADAATSLASLYQSRGEWAKAITLWRRGLEKGLSSYSIRTFLQAISEDQGTQAAIEEATKLIASQKQPSLQREAMLGLLYFLRDGQGGQDATGIARRLVETYPRDVEVLQQVYTLFANGTSAYDPMPAIEKFLAREPQKPEEALEQARLISHVASYGRPAGFARLATEHAERLARLKFPMTPEQQAACLSSCASAQQSAEPAKALDTWRRILALDLPAENTTAHQAANQVFNLAHGQGNLDLARKTLVETAKKAPANPYLSSMFGGLAATLRREKKFDDLLALLTDMRQALPEREPLLRIEAASVKAALGKTAEACEELWAVAEAADASMQRGEEKAVMPLAFHQASRLLVRASAKDNALKARFDGSIEARALTEKLDGDQRWAALQADLLRIRGKLPELTAHLEKLSAHDRPGAPWRHRLAAVYAAARQFPKAADIHQKLLADDPKDIDSWLALADLATAMNQPDKAREYWTTWLNALPSDESTLNQVAYQFARQGATEKAIAAFERLLLIARNAEENAAPSLAEQYQKAGRKLDAALAFVRAMRPTPAREFHSDNLANRLWPFINEEATFNRFVPEVERELAAATAPRHRARLLMLLAQAHVRRGAAMDKIESWTGQALATGAALDEEEIRQLYAGLGVPQDRLLPLLRAAAEKTDPKASAAFQAALARKFAAAKQPAEGVKLLEAALAVASPDAKTELSLALAELAAPADWPRAKALFDEVERAASRPSLSRVLRARADAMAKAELPPQEVIAVYRAALAATPTNQRAEATEALIRYAAETKQHDAVFDGYKRLCGSDRYHNSEQEMQRLATYLKDNAIAADRAEVAFRDCVRAVRGDTYYRVQVWRPFGQFFADRGDAARAVHIWAEGLAETSPNSPNAHVRHQLLDAICQKKEADPDLTRKVILAEMDLRLKGTGQHYTGWSGSYWRTAQEFSLLGQLRAKLLTVPENQPGVGDVYRAVGEAFLGNLHEPDLALKYYKMAIRFPGRNGASDAAEHVLTIYQTGQRWQEGIAQIAELPPQELSARRLAQRGLFQAKLGQADAAAKSYAEASKKAGFRQYAYNEHLEIARSAANAGLHDAAIKEFRLALRIHDAYRRRQSRDDYFVAGCYREIAACYRAKGEDDKAVDQYLAALARVSENHRSQLTQELAKTYQDSPKFDQLVAQYEKAAAETRVEKPMLRVVFGDVCRDRGKLVDALRHYRAALEVAPNRSDVRQRVVEILRRDRAKADDLISEYRQWSRYEPKRLETYREMGQLLTQQGHPDEALRACSTMLDALPTEAESHREMAAVFDRLDRRADAVAMWRKVVQFRPEEPQSHYGLAESLVRNSEPKLAAQVYQDMLGRSWDTRFGDVRSEAQRRLAALEGAAPK